jgi:hypothetical protein
MKSGRKMYGRVEGAPGTLKWVINWVDIFRKE